MANALDIVLQMRKERQARELQGMESFQEGAKAFGQNRLKSLELAQTKTLKERELGMRREKLDIEVQNAKIKQEEAKRMNDLLTAHLAGGAEGTAGVKSDGSVGTVTAEDSTPKATPTSLTVGGVKFDIDTPIEKETRELKQSREERLLINNEKESFFKYGGRIAAGEQDKFKERYNIDPSVIQEQYGLAFDEDPTTGERFLTVPSKKELDERVNRGTFGATEVEHVNNAFQLIDSIEDMKTELAELGITDPNKFGEAEFETVNSNFGPLSLPAKFNLAAQYMKDPKYQALKTRMERTFQLFRKATTGAQASDKELKILRPLIPGFTSREAVFFEGMNDLQQDTRRLVDTRLDVYAAAGRDVGKFRDLLATRSGKDANQGSEKSTGVEMVDANGNRALVDPKTGKVLEEL